MFVLFCLSIFFCVLLAKLPEIKLMMMMMINDVLVANPTLTSLLLPSFGRLMTFCGGDQFAKNGGIPSLPSGTHAYP